MIAKSTARAAELRLFFAHEKIQTKKNSVRTIQMLSVKALCKNTLPPQTPVVQTLLKCFFFLYPFCGSLVPIPQMMTDKNCRPSNNWKMYRLNATSKYLKTRK